MKRTTVMLPDDIDARLRYTARRRGVPVARMVREAVQQYIPVSSQQAWSQFIGAGEGDPVDASERVDEFVRQAVEADYEANRP